MYFDQPLFMEHLHSVYIGTALSLSVSLSLSLSQSKYVYLEIGNICLNNIISIQYLLYLANIHFAK